MKHVKKLVRYLLLLLRSLRRSRPQVEQDIEDAHLLASYVARNGVPGVATSVAAIVNVAQLPRAARTPAVLTAFYGDYQKVAGASLPVTVASLRDSVNAIGWFAPFRRATGVAVVTVGAALLTIFALGHLHADWLALTDLTAQLAKLPPPLTEATRELKAIEAKALRSLIDTPPPEGGDPVKPGGVVYNDRMAQLAAIQLELEADKNAPDRRKPLTDRLHESATETLSDLCLHGLAFKVFGGFADYEKWLANETLEDNRGLSEKMLTNLQKVVLPLLYGVLGSLIFILRHVAMAAASRVFRRETILEHLVRPIIGAVAGFVIGWFMSPDKAGVIADPSVAPFALAFVGGYSIEVVFAALDRLTGK